MSIRMLQLHPPLRQGLRLRPLPAARIPLHWPTLNLPAKLLFRRLYLQLHNQQKGAPSPAKSDKDANTAAKVGGVVGGVIGLALILGACWFFLALQRRETPHPPPITDGKYSSELGTSPIYEAPAYAGDAKSNELAGLPVSQPELHESRIYYELDQRTENPQEYTYQNN